MAGLKKNISSLYVIQAANYLLPLITLPYLIRTLGVKSFGELAFSAAFIQYFVVVTEYGFNLTATRMVSIARDDLDRINRIFMAVYFMKFVLAMVCALVLGLALLLVSDYSQNWALYCVSFLAVIGNALFPSWLFQGFERMPLVTFANVTSKLIITGCIFLFVTSPSDTVLAAAIQSSAFIVSGVISLAMIPYVCPGVRFGRFDWSLMKQMASDGWSIFVSQASAIVVNGSNIFILGLIHGPVAVGHYSVAEKIIKAANNAQVPICNSIYPRSAAKFSRSKEEGMAFLRSVLKYALPLMALGSIAIFVLADYLVHFLAGQKDDSIALMLRILAILPLSVFLDNILGTQILLNIGAKRQFMWAILIAGIVSIVLSLMLVPKLEGTGSAIVYVLAQLTLLVLMYVAVKQQRIKLLSSV